MSTPLQKILKFADVKPADFESWPFNRRPLPCSPSEPFQDRHRAAAEAWADKPHLLIFADAAASRAGVAAAAVLWDDGNRELRAGVRLGEPDSLSILDAEVAAILLATHLVSVTQEDNIIEDVSIYSDSQAAIACINGHAEGASFELLKAARRGIRAARKGSGGSTISLKWCPGHLGVPGIEEADAEASRAASGHCYPPHLVPHYLSDFRPATNPSTQKQAVKTENRSLAETFWALSKAGVKFTARFPGISPRHFLAHTRNLPRSSATLLYRLTTGHVQLRKHLFRLQLADSPQCEHCGLEPETVTHYLFRCSRYSLQRQLHLGSRGPDYLRLSYVLHATAALTPLFDYIKSTGRFVGLAR
jgi:ribonuclease HI